MIRAVAIGAAILAAGCELVFPPGSGGDDADDGDDAPPDDAGPADAAGDAPILICGLWSNASPLGFSAYDPTLRFDELELFYARGSPGDYHIYRRARLSPTDLWSVEEAVPELASPMSENDPALSANGLVIMFQSSRSGAPRFYEARRASVQTSFDPPVIAVGLGSVEAGRGLDLSGDGLRLYYESAAGGVHIVRRSTLSGAFGPAEVYAPTSPYPSVASDDRELFYNVTDQGLAYRSRESAGAAWADNTVLDASADDGDLSADRRVLILDDDDTGLIIVRRTCAAEL